MPIATGVRQNAGAGKGRIILRRAIGWATAATLCVLALPAAWAQSAAPGGEAEQQTAQPWPREDIEAAQARCTAVLKGLDVVAAPEPAMREGTACGAPAPMKLISIGRGPQIAFSPPPTVSCDLIAALHKWLQQDVQPLARTHLGAPLIRVETMSSYSCRNAYGRVNGRLSEHARANALDIGLFTTARADTVLVAANWGPTARDIAAAAKATAEKPQAVTPVARDSSQSVGEPATILRAQPEPVGLGFQQPNASAAAPGLVVAWPRSRDMPIAGGLPNRLGGPKAPSTSTTAPDILAGNKMDFLRGAHRAACKIFGTVLGPEANNAHKNHFHLDMAERKVMAICE
jgi:hypothetical protein